MGTIIKITPPSGIQETISTYETCVVNTSITDGAGSFAITLIFEYNEDISRFVVGTDVQIEQNGHVFRGWVIKPPVIKNGALKRITLEGADYTAKTQKIVVTESYTDVGISTIVTDLFTKYVPWETGMNIGINNRLLTIRFPDVYLWDVMEQICNLSGFDWFIDDELVCNFFEVANTVNNNVIGASSYKPGTANFSSDSSKLVNKLWIKGSKALSLPFTQNITVINATTPIPLFYKPRAGDTGINVVIGGVSKTLGIQNIHDPGTYDFLINVNEKLLIPDLCVSGTGTITYRYEYPIKILLENEESKYQYGEFEDILSVDIEDSAIAMEVGQRYIDKYSKPVLIGSIDPNEGIYKCGELLKVEIESLNINEYLVIKSASYESMVGGIVNIKLTLENTQQDLTNILKDMSKRLRKIETALFGDDSESVVERYKTAIDTINYPKLVDDGYTHKLHDYLVSGPNMMAGGFYI